MLGMSEVDTAKMLDYADINAISAVYGLGEIVSYSLVDMYRDREEEWTDDVKNTRTQIKECKRRSSVVDSILSDVFSRGDMADKMPTDNVYSIMANNLRKQAVAAGHTVLTTPAIDEAFDVITDYIDARKRGIEYTLINDDWLDNVCNLIKSVCGTLILLNEESEADDTSKRAHILQSIFTGYALVRIVINAELTLIPDYITTKKDDSLNNYHVHRYNPAVPRMRTVRAHLNTLYDQSKNALALVSNASEKQSREMINNILNGICWYEYAVYNAMVADSARVARLVSTNSKNIDAYLERIEKLTAQVEKGVTKAEEDLRQVVSVREYESYAKQLDGILGKPYASGAFRNINFIIDAAKKGLIGTCAKLGSMITAFNRFEISINTSSDFLRNFISEIRKSFDAPYCSHKADLWLESLSILKEAVKHMDKDKADMPKYCGLDYDFIISFEKTINGKEVSQYEKDMLSSYLDELSEAVDAFDEDRINVIAGFVNISNYGFRNSIPKDILSQIPNVNKWKFDDNSNTERLIDETLRDAAREYYDTITPGDHINNNDAAEMAWRKLFSVRKKELLEKEKEYTKGQENKRIGIKKQVELGRLEEDRDHIAPIVQIKDAFAVATLTKPSELIGTLFAKLPVLRSSVLCALIMDIIFRSHVHTVPIGILAMLIMTTVSLAICGSDKDKRREARNREGLYTLLFIGITILTTLIAPLVAKPIALILKMQLKNDYISAIVFGLLFTFTHAWAVAYERSRNTVNK